MRRSRALGLLQILGLSALSALGGACAGDTDTPAAEDGQKAYTTATCATCHGAAGGGGIGPNITGSKTAGIGNWTFAEFTSAVRIGVAKDGSDLCAEMTRFPTSLVSDDKLKAVYDYLMSVVNDTANEGTSCK